MKIDKRKKKDLCGKPWMRKTTRSGENNSLYQNYNRSIIIITLKLYINTHTYTKQVHIARQT